MNVPAPATEPEAETGSAAASLTIAKLCCVRGDRVLFDDLDFQLAAGDILQLEGPNGSGKTTLLRAICGLAPVESGRIEWCGEERRVTDETFLGALTYIGHIPGVKLDLSPHENLEWSRTLAAADNGASPLEALTRVGLAGLEHTPLRRLSAGQCRRAALARLLVTRAPLWLLDEPLTALDADGRALVEDLIAAHANAGGMALVSTHQPLGLPDARVQRLRLDGES